MKKHNGLPGPRPRIWITGPDPIRHDQYVSWSRARAQARFRKEPWDLSFDQWVDAWGDRWHLRGRVVDSLCLARRDYDLGWSVDNIEIIDRKTHNRKQREYSRR